MWVLSTLKRKVARSSEVSNKLSKTMVLEHSTDTEIRVGAGRIQIMKISDGLQQLMLGYKKGFVKICNFISV